MTKNNVDIEHIIAKKISGDITPSETKELFDWISESNEHALVYEKMMHNIGFKQKQLRKGAIWKKIENKSTKKESGHPLFTLNRFVKVAAILVLIALIPIALGKYGEDEHGHGFTNTVTGTELVTSFYLPDGTRVFLSRGSELSYNDNYNVKNRELLLKGKAYFEIDEQAAHLPLIVNSGKRCAIARKGKLAIEGEADNLDVSVEEGEVTVVDTVYKKVIIPMFRLQPALPANGKKKLAKFESTKLKQGQRVTYTDEDILAKTEVGNYCEVFSWKDKVFCFSNLKQHELAFKIADWYGKQVEFKGDLSPYIDYSGSYDNPSVRDLIKEVFGKEVKEVKETKRKITVIFS